MNKENNSRISSLNNIIKNLKKKNDLYVESNGEYNPHITNMINKMNDVKESLITDNKMNEYVSEASLSDSYMYNKMNNSSSISTKIISAIKSGIILDKSYIEEQYIQCKRSRISPLVDKVLSAFDNGDIKLIYCKKIRIGNTLPYVVIKKNNSNKSVAFIFVSDFSSLSKDGLSITIEMKKLYVLMESAYIAKEYYTYPSQFQRNSALAKITADIYSSMSMRIYNKEFALSLNKDLYDNINFCTSKFYLENVFGLTNESIVNSYATRTCLNPDTKSIEMITNMYDDAGIENIKNLIDFVSTVSPKLEKLNFRYFFERWISTYGTGACLSIDAFPYLTYVISNVLLGGFLVNVVTLNDMIKNTKAINMYYSELSKILK